FARNLARLTELPIALWDERLSTAAVERELIAANVTRARRAKVIDQHAAAFILQGALDRLARGAPAPARHLACPTFTPMHGHSLWLAEHQAADERRRSAALSQNCHLQAWRSPLR